MMVPTSDYNTLVNYYKGRITENTLLNKAGRLAAERHLTLKDPKVSDSVALAVTKPKAQEVRRLTKRIYSGGAASSSSSSPHPDTEGDDLLLTPLENKLDKILRATQKHAGGEEWVDVSDKTTAPTKKVVKFKDSPKPPVKPKPKKNGGWKKAVGRGALKGVGKSMGVSLDNDQEGAGTSKPPEKKRKRTPRAVKALRAAPGWEDFTEGRKLRRQLLPEYDDTDDEEAWAPTFGSEKPLCTV